MSQAAWETNKMEMYNKRSIITTHHGSALGETMDEDKKQSRNTSSNSEKEYFPNHYLI